MPNSVDEGQPDSVRVLVAGVAGASLGTEIVKALAAAGRYDVFACDVSPLAFGLYDPLLSASTIVPREGYAKAVLEWCTAHGIRAVIPGAEEPLLLLGRRSEAFRSAGILLAANAPDVIDRCTDKATFFRECATLGIPIPQTAVVRKLSELPPGNGPWVVKPASGTGGSTMVFLARGREDAVVYVSQILRSRDVVLVQEYIPEGEGEYTVGVLSLQDGRVAASVAMRRLFHCKLSVATRTPDGMISSGYSQGLIDRFPEVRAQCEDMARRLGSRGPLNIQGRIRQGRLLPFEVNARFSASTYLRTLAGVNEVDLFLRHALHGTQPPPLTLRPGYYLRSLCETYVSKERVLQ